MRILMLGNSFTFVNDMPQMLAELLMSDKGAFITGSTFLIDGGATSSYFYGPLKPQENN